MARERWIRIIPLAGGVVVAALLLVGWERPRLVAGPSAADHLFLRSGDDLTVVRSTPDADAIRLRNGVAAPDWSAVVQTRRGEVTAVDPTTGAQLWSRSVSEDLDVKLVSSGARLVALGPPSGGIGYPTGRSTTTLVLVGSGEPRTIELEGNYEPEAFSADGQSMFVVEYLPPRAPTHYRVRRLDLETGEVLGVYSVDAHLQEAMQGTARIQAASPDGRRLYTLYTVDVGGVQRAFVHVLSLDELWAHCVDLPTDFEVTDESAIALAVSPDGRRLHVADTASDTVVEVDTARLGVTRTVSADVGTDRGVAHAATGPDGTVFVARGSRVVALDVGTLSARRSWDLERRITGIQLARDGRRLYVGLRDEVVVLDTLGGERLAVLDPAGIETIDELGRAARQLSDVRDVIKCAC